VAELRTQQKIIVTLAAILASGLLLLAWPRMQASYRFLPVDLAISRYYQDREIPAHRLLTLTGFARQAIEYHDHYRYHDGLSFLHYLRGLDIYTPALERRGEYRLAEIEAVETVTRAPAQPEAWLRIATVRMVLRDEPEEVIEPWKMSIFSGRTHSTLLVPRVDVGLAYLGLLDTESRAMLRDQLLLAWELMPGELILALGRSDPGLEKTRLLLGGGEPAMLLEMEARIEKIR
jgi:hypothetical protein